MRLRVHTLIAVALLLLLPASIVEASTAKEALVEVYPAPIGYTVIFQPPYPSRVYGFRDDAGNFYPYRASLENNGLMILIDNIYRFKTVITSEGASTVKILNDLKLEAIGVTTDKGDNYILFTGGQVYTSPYYIFINTVPPNPSAFDVFERRRVLVFSENSVDFRISAQYGYSLGLVVTSQLAPISVYTKDGVLLSMRLSDLLGVSDACITWFSDLPPGETWIGGVVLSPTCMSNLRVIKTYVYNNRPYAVAFSLKTRYGDIDYVIMAKPTVAVLKYIGILFPVTASPPLHIAKTADLSVRNIYIAVSDQGYVALGKKFNAIDITQMIEVSKGRRSYVCMIPARSSLVFALAWRRIDISSTSALELLPGEVVLIEADGKHYFCHGDMSWLDYAELPVVRASQFREIVYPIQLLSSSGQPFLAVLANGKVYLSNDIIIDFNEYQQNELFVYAIGAARRITITQASIFLTPFFGIAVIIVLVFASVVLFKGKKNESDIIRVIIDFPKPYPRKVASENDVVEAAKKHVNMFGVCPDLFDIVIFHNMLPPLPEKVPDPEQEIVCPFNTNPETESVLRYISNTLLSVLWVTKRTSPSAGYFYTILGNTMLYMYFYKHEGEPVEKAIVNAVTEAMKIRIISPFYMMPLGLVIVTTDDRKKVFDDELEYLMTLSTAAGESVRSYAISSYITVKGVPTTEPPDELQKFVNEKVPTILVVSYSNLPELLKYLAEKLSSYAKFYYSTLKGESGGENE